MATLEQRAQTLAPLIGKGFAVAKRRIQNSKLDGVAYLGINTLVVDIKGGDPVVIPGIDVEPGVLVKSDIRDLEKYGLTEAHLQFADFGGQGNIVPVAKRILGEDSKVGVMGALGKDAFSQFFKDGMDSMGINTYGLMDWADIPIGISIMTKGSGERSGIAYFYRANGFFEGTDGVKEGILFLNPKIGHNSYIGLSPMGWDMDNGRNASRFLKWQQDLGIITITDTHTFGSEQDVRDKVKIAEYKLLEAPLEYTNIFICSLGEAKRIMNTWEIDYDVNEKPEDIAAKFSQELTKTYFEKEKRTSTVPRIFGVSMREGVLLCYQDASYAIHDIEYVLSNYRSIEGVDLVGAGDSLKASLGAYIIQNWNEFGKEAFKVKEAAQFAQLGATLYVAAPKDQRGVARFENISGYSPMLVVVQSGEQFSKLSMLQKALRSAE